MRDFAKLVGELDLTNKTNAKIDILVNYFKHAADEDKLWTLALLSGRRPRRQVKVSLLRDWAAEYAGMPMWLFDESYHVAGDLAETIAMVLPPPEGEQDKPMAHWIRMLMDLGQADEETKKRSIIEAWKHMDSGERFVFNKLITGGFRIGVSQNLAVKALEKLTGIDKAIINHRLMGNWDPSTTTFEELILTEDGTEDLSKPYPFFLAHPLEGELTGLGEPHEWQAEWKWDGIRGQLIKREGELFLWSRGEELVTERFPEFEMLNKHLPDGLVLDGEILPFKENKPLSFNDLQTRIGRKNVSAAIMRKAPVVFMMYDVMEYGGKDVRERPLSERMAILESIYEQAGKSSVLQHSAPVEFADWESLQKLKDDARNHYAEGLMLKKKESPYLTGRKRGHWWKWKLDPLTVDGVLIYAQKGHGRRANLYTDYTFGVWNGSELVPFAKAYSGLTDKEFRQVDTFVKQHTKEKFGPVRTVQPELVFEIGFEGIAQSKRHKSGIALRFPRMLRWRTDKQPRQADTLQHLHELLQSYG